MAVFVQLGATRDGLDPYLHAARRREMQVVLIETPDYILLRRLLNRREFDRTVAVEHPAHESEVLTALEQFPEAPVAILAGFERYIYNAYAIAKKLCILPWGEKDHFTPLNKAQQRALLTEKQASLKQPGYIIPGNQFVTEDDLASLSYPLVVKPVDGGGGLGVFLGHTFAEVKAALDKIYTMTNYDGEEFGGVIIEEYLPGVEYSVQGVARDGRSHILAFCKKFILTEQVEEASKLQGFREAGHIAIPGDEVDSAVQQFAQDCVDAFAYCNGPFHIDMIQSLEGFSFLEMGFRLSGNGVARLVQGVSGVDWAEAVLAIHMGEHLDLFPLSSEPFPCIGQFNAASNIEIEMAHQLQRQGYHVDIQPFASLSTPVTARSLESDLSRHVGTRGRITVQAPTVEEVEHVLRLCSPERAIIER